MASRPKQRVRVAHKSEGRPVSRGIRWDRLPGNWLIVILLVMGALYVPPLKGYYEQRKATSAAKSTLQQVGKENRALKARARSLKKESTIELEARKLGMVNPEERPFVILR
ncbi:MAG: septum formation initiator family protein [Thermoleophilaceae bacterium]|nr:septum formation initiator family protein [Thermoleophilaceae bacterium]